MQPERIRVKILNNTNRHLVWGQTLWAQGNMYRMDAIHQSCPWVGLTHGLGRDFSVFGGLGWVGSTTAKVLKKFERIILTHLKHC